MEVKLAKTAGFCFGVQRAVDTVHTQIEEGSAPIYTYGPIVHNETVVQELEEKGVQVLNTKEELASLKEGTVIIRAHGVGKHIYDLLEQKGLHLVDATCPFVRKIHRIVQKEGASGRSILIIGSAKHPEVEGIRGWCSTPSYVVESVEEAQNFTIASSEKLCVVSQTTFNYKKFKDLVEISKNECENTYHIQELEDLDFKASQSIRCVGITAGASTPKKIIEEVQKHVGIKF